MESGIGCMVGNSQRINKEAMFLKTNKKVTLWNMNPIVSSISFK